VISRVFWSFKRFQGYFGHFKDFGGIWSFRDFGAILIIFFRFRDYFGHFEVLGGILVIFFRIMVFLVILEVTWVFWSFFRFHVVLLLLLLRF